MFALADPFAFIFLNEQQPVAGVFHVLEEGSVTSNYQVTSPNEIFLQDMFMVAIALD